MGKKSIIEIDIQDEQFKKFLELFERYQKALKGQPGLWRAAGAAMDEATEETKDTLSGASKSAHEYSEEIRKGAENWREMGYVIGASVLAGQQAMGGLSRNLDRQTKKTQEFTKAWKEAKDTMLSFAAGLGLVFGVAELVQGTKNTAMGLLGRGPLPFGIDRLAYGAGGAYRASTGLGVSIGEREAFGIQFGQLVDQNKLNDVQSVRYDLSRRGQFAAMGIYNPEQGDVADLTIRMMRRAQQLYRTGMSDQQMQAMGFGQFFNREELNRLRGADLNQVEGAYRRDVTRLGYDPDVARAWQEFGIKLHESSSIVEKTLITSLGKLVDNGTLPKLSDAVVKLVEALGESPKVRRWLDELAVGIERLAKWLNPGGAGADGLSDKDRAMIEKGYEKIPGKPGLWRQISKDAPVDTRGPLGGMSILGIPLASGSMWGPNADRHNPGNMMIPGTHTLAQFASDQNGLLAMARQLLRYQDHFHLTSVEGIIRRYAPPNENDVGAYIRDVYQRTGFKRGSKVDLHDEDQLERLISAITKHENRNSDFTPTKVKAVIENRTGSNVVVNATQAAATVQGNQ